MPFQIVQGDITTMEVDAVVNAANEELQMGSGVCGSIFRAAGKQDLQRECDAIGHCATGQAVMTGGYGLPAGHIIHTVGPVWRGGAQGEAALLAGCYQSSLRLAAAAGLHSVAFPLISSGIYGYPPEEALRIAGASITSFLEEHELDVYLVIFDRRVFSIGEERLRGVQRYIDEHWRDAPAESVPPPIPAAAEPAANAADLVRGAADALRELRSPSPFIGMHRKPLEHSKKTADTTRRLEDLVNQLDESFSQMLLRLIDEKGKSDVQVYKRANIDRKLFSKIRSNPAYNPSKATAIALCVALELSLDEVRDLLGRAGYALSPSNKFDVIVEYFIEQGIYDIFAINEALFAFDQGLLGA